MLQPARTSILSNQWRQLWSTLPHLVFDDLFFQYASEKAASIIHKILMQHTGPIQGFHLIFGTLAQSDVDQCIIFVLNHGVQKLTLYLCNTDYYALPDSIFTCSTLIHVKLHRCIFKLTDGTHFPNLVSLTLHDLDLELPRPVLKGFYRLISLELCRVTFLTESLVALISHCLLLEQLVLKSSDIVFDIVINAPMLRSFEFTGSVEFISLKNSPLLEKLSLMEIHCYPMLGKCDIANSFESFSALDHLSLCNINLQILVLGAGKVPAFNVDSVKRLYISGFLDESTVACALCLLRCIRYLQHIEI